MDNQSCLIEIRIETKHSYNANQIAWFKAGSALNLIRRSNEKVNANGK